MKYLLFPLIFLICTVSYSTHNVIHYDAKTDTVDVSPNSNNLNTPDTVEKIDAFIALVEKHLDSFYKVEKETTGEGFNECGKGSITAYFQGDYTIKWIEVAEINGLVYKETYYLYNLKPIYIHQEITDAQEKVEDNVVYMNNGLILQRHKNGKLMEDKNEAQKFTPAFNRFEH